MPNDTRPPADCHPDKPRKTADGRCDACYSRDRYQNDPAWRERYLAGLKRRYQDDPEYRARKLAAAAKWQEKTYGKRDTETCNDCGQTYIPARRHEQHHTCQDCRNKNGGRPLIGMTPCQMCGQEFKRREQSTKFCGYVCAGMYNNPKQAKEALEGFRISDAARQAIYDRDQWKCQLCRKIVGKTRKHPHPRSPSLDHIVPRSLGGTDDPANLQLAHLRCNIIKSNHVANGGEQLRLVG